MYYDSRERICALYFLMGFRLYRFHFKQQCNDHNKLFNTITIPVHGTQL